MMEKKDFNFEEKEIYELLNGIKFDESELEEIEMDVSDIQKKRIKKNLNKRINGKQKRKALKYGSAVAAAGLASMIGIGTLSPTFAANIPVLSSIIQVFNDDQGEYAKYSKILNQGVTDNGITLTINEVLADESKLMIGYTITSKDKLNKHENIEIGHTFADMEVNGEYSDPSGGTGKFTDNYNYVASSEYDLYSVKSAKNLNVDLKFDEVAGVKGKWKFAFSVSKEDIFNNTAIFNPKQKIEFPDSTITIEKVVLSPLGTYLSLSGVNKEKQEVPHSLFNYSDWFAFDDQGVELSPKAIGGGESDGKKFTSQMEFMRMKEIPKSITIVPAEITPAGGGGVSDDGTPYTYKGKEPNIVSKKIDGTFPIELEQGKLGKLSIKEIKTENNQTIVTYTADGKLPYYQASSLSIEDENGEIVQSVSEPVRGNTKNEFTAVFAGLDKNKKYRVVTNDFDHVELREDLKFTIEL